MIVYLAAISLSLLCQTKGSERHDVQMIYNEIFRDYNKDLGPNTNQTAAINVQIIAQIFTIHAFDDKTGKFSVLAGFSISWTDDRLAWDPFVYGNVTRIHVPPQKVWTPTLFVGIPFDDVKGVASDVINVEYSDEGHAIWFITDLYHVTCGADIAYYPIDKQKCIMYVIPYNFGQNYNFSVPYDFVVITSFFENGIWSLLSAETKKMFDPIGNYVGMTVKFQRRPLFVLLIFLLPVNVIGVLNPFVFLLPPEPGERSCYGVTLMLAMAVFLSTVSEKLPSTSDPHIARVCLYLLFDLIMSGLIMLFTILGLKLHTKKDAPIPGWIQRVVVSCTKDRPSCTEHNIKRPKAPKWRHIQVQAIDEQLVKDKVHISDKNKIPNVDHRSCLKEDQCSDTTVERQSCAKCTGQSCSWRDVAKLFDRVCFGVFSCIQVCRFVTNTVDFLIYMNSDI
ncbi:acetylcholine receptor subunit beta-like [Argopecten irradians]|uniref:acetylcholine receptor subunit beta-like n=1 Tax=Argopecten irradians TaxID=31199 RepID=UPI00372311E2